MRTEHWTAEIITGWCFLITAIIGFLIYFTWIHEPIVMGLSFFFWGLAVSNIRLAIRGREQSQLLTIYEGHLITGGLRNYGFGP